MIAYNQHDDPNLQRDKQLIIHIDCHSGWLYGLPIHAENLIVVVNLYIQLFFRDPYKQCVGLLLNWSGMLVQGTCVFCITSTSQARMN